MTRLGAVLVVVLVSAACGGDSDSPGPATGGAGAPDSTGPAPTRSDDGGGTSLELSAENIAFSTSSLRADAGEVTIGFANNDDGVPHNLHVTGVGVDEKTDIEPGPVSQRLALTLESGTYTYVCDVHPQQMTGTLTVS